MPRKDEQRSLGIRTFGSLRRGVRPEVFNWARELRRNPAPGEMRLWDHLRAQRLGFKFNRQAILRGWIADIWCPAKRLVVEVDGWSHRHDSRQIEDRDRDRTLREKFGIQTLRFPVERIYDELNSVVAEIRRAAAGRPTSYIPFGWTSATRRAPWAKNQLGKLMDNQVRIEMPDLSQSDKDFDEAVCLYREAREDMRKVSSTDEATRIKQQFEKTIAVLKAECGKIATLIRSLDEHWDEIQKKEIELRDCSWNARKLKLEQDADPCKRGHKIVIRQLDGDYFLGCEKYRELYCKCTEKLTPEQRSFLGI